MTPAGLLNPGLDVKALSKHLADAGRIVIRDVFTPDTASRLHEELASLIPWRLAYVDTRVTGDHQNQQLTREQFAAMGPKKAAALRALILSQARDNFQYLYQHFNLGGGQISGEIDGLFLSDLMDYVRGDEFQELARQLTGVEELNDIYAHATLYTAGNFLKVHEDVAADDDRRFAHVFGFTRNWRADMGGLLHFLDDDGRIVDTLVPGFNTLTLFRVPTSHLVSMVAPWVREPRLAVTGWLRVEQQ
jgi:Rps23 Pro-64 3,4-dihydroxylase Tpa1-like proline 4-hydroxylase